MNKPSIRPDTTMNDYRDPRLDYVMDYLQDQDVPETIMLVGLTGWPSCANG